MCDRDQTNIVIINQLKIIFLKKERKWKKKKEKVEEKEKKTQS